MIYPTPTFIAPSTVDMHISTETKILTWLAVADFKIKPLQDAFDLEIATDVEKANLVKWKKFRVALSRIDTTKPETEIVFPEIPE